MPAPSTRLLAALFRKSGPGFQADAFQADAFQVATAAPVATPSLPATISAVATWPDHKNATLGPFDLTPYGPVFEQQRAAAPTLAVGAAAGTTRRAQSFVLPLDATWATTTTEVGRLQIRAGKVGAPADNLSLAIHTDSAGLPSGTSVAGATIAGTTLTTAADGAWIDVAVTPAALTQGTRYWLVVARSGSVDAANHYRWAHTAANAVPDEARALHDGASWAAAPGGDHAFRLIGTTATPTLYVFLVDKDADTLVCWRSRDRGSTWVEADPDFHPACSSTAGQQTLTAFPNGAGSTDLAVLSPSSTSALASRLFSTVTDGWGAAAGSVALTQGTNVAGVMPLVGAPNSAATYYVAYNGATESVGGTPYRRAKLASINGTTATVYDVATGTSSEPGTAVHYDLRAAILGDGNRWHVFWTQSDSTQVKARTLAGATLSAAINPASGAVGDQLANYPLGLPVAYTAGGATSVGVFYRETWNSAVIRCASSLADVAGNWTAETAAVYTNIGFGAEIVAANPGCLATDGTKLWLWFVEDISRDIVYLDDGAAGAWTSPVTWKEQAAVNADALTARVVTDGIGVVYLDSSVTPAAVRYDRLVVFAVKASHAVGDQVATYDFGTSGPNGLVVVIDYGSGADPAGTVDVLIEFSHDAGAWIEYARSTGSTRGTDTIQIAGVGRYLRVVTTTSVADSESGVTGA